LILRRSKRFLKTAGRLRFLKGLLQGVVAAFLAVVLSSRHRARRRLGLQGSPVA
jgi:hypothetical protein